MADAAATAYDFPDVETLVVMYLSGREELQDVPVLADLPEGTAVGAPTVLVTRLGGQFAVDDRLDHALVRVETFGADKPSAHRLAVTVRGLVWAMPVVDVAEQRGPRWRPDRRRERCPRYLTRYLLTVRVQS